MLKVLVFLVVPLTSVSLCDKILPFLSFAFFFFTPLFYSIFPIASPCSETHSIECHEITWSPAGWGVMKLCLTASVALPFIFRCCMFLKRAAMFNIVKYDASPPPPTIESSDEFQSTLSRIELHYAQHTCPSTKLYSPERMQGE